MSQVQFVLHMFFTCAFMLYIGGVQAGYPACFDSAYQRAISNRSFWMQILDETCPAYFRSKTLNEITLPGSHDAAAYDSAISDAGACSMLLGQETCRNWFVTQSGNFKQQLHDGSRYFDIRVHWVNARDCAQGGGAHPEMCWIMWHPNMAGSYFWFHRIPGMEFAPLREAITHIKEFMLSHPKEIVIMRLKLQQFVEKTFFMGEDATKTKERLHILQQYLNEELGSYVANSDGNSWQSLRIDQLIHTNRRLVLISTGENEDDVKKYEPWLGARWGDACKGSALCEGAMWKSGFANKCCSVGEVQDDQVEKRNLAPAALGGSDRPLIRLSNQFTFQVPMLLGYDFDNLRDASFELKPTLVQFYNEIAAIDRQNPVANILGGDFVNDCPEATVAFAVCGSLLPPGLSCNTTLPCSSRGERAWKFNIHSKVVTFLIILMTSCIATCFAIAICCKKCHEKEDDDDDEEEDPLAEDFGEDEKIMSRS